MKGYNGMVFVPVERVTFMRRTNGSTQAHACVQASSLAALMRSVGCTRGEAKNYWSDALTPDMEAALAQHPAGTVLVRPDRHFLIDGQSAWVPLKTATAPPTGAEGAVGSDHSAKPHTN